MLKKIVTYILCLNIAFFPIAKSYAFFPLAIVAAEAAIDVAAPLAIRYVGTEIAVSLVNKAMRGSNAYYSAVGKISKLKYAKFFNKKVLLGSALFVAALDGMGYLISNNSIAKQQETQQGHIAPQKGFYWQWRGTKVNSPDNLLSAIKRSPTMSFLTGYELIKTQNDDAFIVNFLLSSGNKWAGSGDVIRKQSCVYGNNNVDTCLDNYTAPTEPVQAYEFQAAVVDWMDKLPDEEKRKYFADEANKILDGLKNDIQVDAAPTMPDGSPLPSVGSLEWQQANWLLQGTSQGTDSEQPHYIAPSQAPTANYLANTIANGNSHITSLNAGEKTPTNQTGNKENTTNQTGSTTANVNTTGIESRIDTTNELLRSIGSATVEAKDITSLFDDDSLWSPNKYPDGLVGIWGDFRSKLDNTPIFNFINSFKTNYGNGVVPVWRLDLSEVGFGCMDISIKKEYWDFMRVVFIASAVVYSRKIIIG